MTENTLNSLEKLANNWASEATILERANSKELQLVGEMYGRCSKDLKNQVEACRKNEADRPETNKSRSAKASKSDKAIKDLASMFEGEDEIILSREGYEDLFGKNKLPKKPVAEDKNDSSEDDKNA